MIPYLACLVSFTISSFVFNREFRMLLLYAPLIILCFGYMTGSDWRSYELIYNGLMQRDYEPGLNIIFNVGNLLKLSFWITLIILKIVCYIKTISIFQKYFQKVAGIFLALFFAEWGFYLFIDNPLRSFMSFYFSLFVLDNYLSEKNRKALVFTIVAILFHFSAAFLLLLFLIKKPFKSAFVYISIFTLLFVISTYYFEASLTNIINLLYGDFFESRLIIYLENNQFLQSENKIGYIHRIFFLFLLTMNLRNIPNIRFEKIIMAYALLYIILYPITSKIIVLKRMELFLVVPFCMAIFNIVYNKKNLRRVFVSIIIGYSFLKSILLFSTDYRYVPYTNILIETLKGSKYNYNQRSEFNHKNSPYEK